MRLRLHSVIYQSGSAAPSLEQHYRTLRGAMFHLGQQYSYLQPGAIWRPAMDIHETPSAVLVKIELAGMDEDSIEITLYPNAIVVTGQRIDDSDYDEETYYHEAQIRYGPFRADAFLSTPIQAEMASALYQNGFLRITLPRRSAIPEESGKISDGETGDVDIAADTNDPSVSASSPASYSMICEPATGGLTSSYSKETSHA
ncbi:MAG TPA: Hsp20/alpha crystallin family protein [Ktedonobacterales bacterium]|jgi:HSP20 family molecular chaperone IbpA